MAQSKLELAVDSGKWDAGIKKAQQSFNSFVKDQGGMSSALQKNSSKMEEFINIMGKTKSSANTASGALRDYKSSFEQLSYVYSQLTDKEKKSPFGKATAASLEKLKVKIQESKSQMDNINSGLSGKSAGGGIGSMTANSLLQMTGALTMVSTAVSTYTEAIKSNIQSAATFEKSLSSLQSLTGMSSNEMEFFKNAAIELGSTTTQSASQVAEAFKLIGSAKPELLEDKEALKQVTKEAITLAEAAGIEVPEAAKALATSLNQFGLSASKSSDVINTLAAASQKGSGDISYLNSSMVNVGATARTVGVSFSDTVAALEAIAKNSIDASTAGTGMRNVLLALEKQNDDNLKPSIVGLSTALENLQKKEMSAEESMNLFGRGNVAVASALINNRDVFDSLKDSIVGTNTAYEQAAINTDNYEGSIKNLESAWEGLNLTINSSNSMIRPFVDSLTSVVNSVTEITKAAKNLYNSSESFKNAGGGIFDLLTAPIQNKVAELKALAAVAENFNKKVEKSSNAPGLRDLVSQMANNATSSTTSNAAPQVQTAKEDPIVNSIETQKNKIKELTELWEKAGSQELRDNYKKQIEDANVELKAMTGELDEILKKQSEAYEKRTNNLMARESKEESDTIDSFLKGGPSLNGDLGDAFEPGSINALNQELTAAKDALNNCTIGTEEWAEALQWVKEVEGKLSIKQEGKNTAAAWQSAGNAIHGVGAALSAIDDPAAKVVGLVAQAIASVASGAGQAMAAKDTTASGWAWIGAAAAITAEMVAIVSTIKSSTQYHAAGGIVGASGLARGTDTVPAMLTPGELVLNQAQQSSLASRLGGPMGGMQLSATIKGEDIRLALNNNGRRTGRGEIVTTR